jgi:hypothetical protein
MVGVDCVIAGEPSPKSNLYEAIVSGGGAVSGSNDPEPSKFAVNGGLPVVGDALSTAVGALFGLHTWLSFTV